MSWWPEYRDRRSSWGIGAFGRALVELETTDGLIGLAPTTGGVLVAAVVEQHLSQFVEGRPVTPEAIAEGWQQMYLASLPYGRRGVALHALSAIDLAWWDALGRCRGEPVHALLGGKRRDRLALYATGPRPDVARLLGFVGGKLPLPAGAGEGPHGLIEDLELARRMRESCGPADAFFLAYDCYMSLDLQFAKQLADGVADLGFRWVEECLPPDEYQSSAALRNHCRGRIAVATGEHEGTRWGFELLAQLGCADILQPDLNWCGGLSELLRIAEVARKYDLQLIPHGSSVYSYQMLSTLPEEVSPFAEFPVLGPDGTTIRPVFEGLLDGEPLPRDGWVAITDSPGFGLSRAAGAFHRPFGGS